MPDLQPFHGLRYDTARVELSNVICPPYDVIKGDARDQLLARSPFNIVGVELAVRYGEPASPADYARCADLLQQWQREGVLRRDDPAFYLYEQEFAVPGTNEKRKRRGVMGALRLEAFGAGVQPHEHTLSGPKADRLQLLRAVRANTSPIFALYTDRDAWIDGLLENVALSAPDGEARDAEGITHRLWRVTDDETVNAIVAVVEDEPLLIADGHHRYETALSFRDEAQQKAQTEGKTWTGDEPENFVLMMCVSTGDEGLIVLPTHRVVLNLPHETADLLPDNLAALFDVEALPPGDAPAMLERLNESSEHPRLAMHIARGSFLLTLRPGEAHRAFLDAARSDAYNALDVTVLHDLILQKELGIDAAALAAGGRIAYTIDAQDAIKTVDEGRAGAVFFLRATPVEAVSAVAAAGDKMPQKSTYFYPKLATGMVVRPLS